MCAAPFDPRDILEESGFLILRVKHEVSSLAEGEEALYWECHVKFNGPWRRDRRGVSRDLYRRDRWYMTRRRPQPFDVDRFVLESKGLSKGSKYDSHEYEACILDTNPAIDKDWM